jgi:hypothetical protein
MEFSSSIILRCHYWKERKKLVCKISGHLRDNQEYSNISFSTTLYFIFFLLLGPFTGQPVQHRETQDEGQRECMGLQYRKREQGRQCEFRCLRR